MSQKQCKGLIAVTAGNLHNGTVCAIHLRWPFVIMLTRVFPNVLRRKFQGSSLQGGAAAFTTWHCCVAHLKTAADNLYLMGQVQLSSIATEFHFQHVLFVTCLQTASQCPPDLLYSIRQALFFPLTDVMFILCIVA